MYLNYPDLTFIVPQLSRPHFYVPQLSRPHLTRYIWEHIFLFLRLNNLYTRKWIHVIGWFTYPDLSEHYFFSYENKFHLRHAVLSGYFVSCQCQIFWQNYFSPKNPTAPPPPTHLQVKWTVPYLENGDVCISEAPSYILYHMKTNNCS